MNHIKLFEEFSLNERKLKKPKEAWFKETNDYWKTVKDAKVIVTDEYFYNGEGHYKGYWKDDPTKKFDLPDVFFMDAELEKWLEQNKNKK